MPSRLIFHPSIADDVQTVCAYYDSKVPGLGDQFKATFYARVDQIAAMPLAYPVRFDDIRTALFRRFPYLVFYAVETETVFVLTVQYAGRDPAWLREIATGRR